MEPQGPRMLHHDTFDKQLPGLEWMINLKLKLPILNLEFISFFKVYILSNCLIYNIEILAIVTFWYITSPGLIYFVSESLYFGQFHPFCHPRLPAPGKHQSFLYIYEFVLFCFCTFHIKVRLYSMSFSELCHVV